MLFLLFMSKDSCLSELLSLSLFNPFSFPSELSLDILIGREFNPLTLIEGKVNLPIDYVNSQVYEDTCYSLGCFDSSGVWSTKHIDYKHEAEDCLISGYGDCYQEYEPVCSVLVPTTTPVVYTPDVFENGIYQTLDSYTTDYHSADCSNTTSSYSLFHPLEERFDIDLYPTNSSILNRFTLNTDYNISFSTYTDGVYEEGVYTSCEYQFRKGMQLVVATDGPYEPGVYDETTYERTYHIGLYTNPSNCLDDCVLEKVVPIGAYRRWGEDLTLDIKYDCHPTFPSSIKYLTGEGKHLLIEETTCSEGFEEGLYERRRYYYDLDLIPYEPLIYEPGVYSDQHLLSSYPIGKRLNPNFCCIEEDVGPLAYQVALLNEFLSTHNLAPNSEYYPIFSKERKEIVDCSACYTPILKTIDGEQRLTRFNGKEEEVLYKGMISPYGALVVDIGYIHPGSTEFILLKKDVPVDSNGRFRVEVKAPHGVKTVRLKGVTGVREIYIGITYGDNPISPLLLRTYKHPSPLSFPANQVIVEDLAITLILLMLSGYKEEQKECKTYSKKEGMYYIEPYLKEVIEENLTKIGGLISKEVRSEGFNGIPSVIYNDSTYESLYKEEEVEENTCYVKGVYKAECDLIMDDVTMIGDEYICLKDCFSEAEDLQPRLSSRVDIRTIAWLVISYTTYLDVFPQGREEYEDIAIRLGEYLLSRTTVYLIDEGEGSSRSSANIMVCLALLKLYELTARVTYLNKAADLYTAINEFLYSFKDRVFIHDIKNPTFSVEATIYGLIFSLWTKQEDKIENLLKELKLKRKTYRESYKIAIQNEEGYITSISGEEISIHQNDSYEMIRDGYYDLLIPFYTSPQEVGYSLADSIRLMLLGDYVLKAAQELNFFIGFSNNHLDSYIQEVNKDVRLHTSMSLASCLVPSFLNHPLLLPSCIKELTTLLFNREYITDQLKKMIPIGFGWFNKNALGKQSNLGRLLRSFSYALASFYPSLNNRAMSYSLSSSQHFNLDKWEEELELPRWDGETPLMYKQRVRDYLLNKTIDVKGVTEILRLYGISLVDIRDISIQSFDSFTHTQSSFNSIPSSNTLLIGSSDVNGFIANSPTVFITIDKPVLPPIYREISKLTPVGVMVKYIEQLDYISCSLPSTSSPSSLEITIPSTLPSFSLEPLCCIDSVPVPCGSITYRLTLSHVFHSPLYLYRTEDNYRLSTLEEGEIPLLVIPTGVAYKYFLLKG